MNKFIKQYIESNYGFDPTCASEESLGIVDQIILSDVTMDHDFSIWDFTPFQNLKKLDCSYNPIEILNVSKNSLLEEIRWEGVRGALLSQPDLSGNPHLKKITAGQDGLMQLDLTNNSELEVLSIFLNSSMRWLNIEACKDLKEISLVGVNIPFVDLTGCTKLQKVDISYLNLYKNQYDEYGPGYPRPFVFVNETFDENIIERNTREYSYYTYYLIRVIKGSPEEKFLEHLRGMKKCFLAIPEDRYGRGVAKMHYSLLNTLHELRTGRK